MKILTRRSYSEDNVKPFLGLISSDLVFDVRVPGGLQFCITRRFFSSMWGQVSKNLAYGTDNGFLR